MASHSHGQPIFESVDVESERKDGYWVEAVKLERADKAPGIVSSGLASGSIAFLDNPICKDQTIDQEWQRYEIGKFEEPVSLATADIGGEGRSDIIICNQYGPHMLRCDMKGGIVSWLENPGRDKLGDGHWKQRYIGRWPAMHRLKAGYFTQRSFIEVVAAPVVRGAHDKGTPIPILIFQRPSNLDAAEWPRDIVDDQHFTIIHELTIKKFDGANGLDSMLVSSSEGVSRLYYQDGKWMRDIIGQGEPRQPHQSPEAETPGSGDYWGTGSADAGKFGNDPFAYVAAVDPFHGATLSVYHKTNRGMSTHSWTRRVVDTFGTPSQRLKHGEGPAHFVGCGDFDGDGNDEFLVSLFGPVHYDDDGKPEKPDTKPDPSKGILYYKPIDLENGVFAKWKISTRSSARLAIGDFTNSKRVDFASISYNVPNYYEEPRPTVSLFKNVFAVGTPTALCSIYPTLWADEFLIRVRNPSLYPEDKLLSDSLPLVAVANVEVGIQVLGRGQMLSIDTKTGIKVLHGSLAVLDGEGSVKKVLQPANIPHPSAHSTMPCFGHVQADADAGAVILFMAPRRGGQRDKWRSAGEVPVRTLLDLSALGLQAPELGFTKVEELPWGEKFKGMEFYNMSGFHVRFFEDGASLAHVQFWVAGKNVDAGLHNHRRDLFGEIHVALSHGSGAGGGMWCVKPAHADAPLNEAEKLPPSELDFVELGALQEHGGMWKRADGYGGESTERAPRREDGTLYYPWHAWRAGSDDWVDVWVAVELDADLV